MTYIREEQYRLEGRLTTILAVALKYPLLVLGLRKTITGPRCDFALRLGVLADAYVREL